MALPSGKLTFLERSGYRKRRMRDVARVLPLFALLLFNVPLLWPRGDVGAYGTSRAVIFIFVVWALLIVVTGILLYLIGAKQSEDMR